MTLQIHTDLEGNLSAVWRDPYEWVDPFAEAEFWALEAAEVRLYAERRLDAERQRYDREVSLLNDVIQTQHKAMTEWAALHAPPIIVKGPADISLHNTETK